MTTKKLLLLLSILLGLWTFQQCRPLDEQLGGPRALKVSLDSVFFDTLISEWPSFTRSFRVYNEGNTAVRIKQVALQSPNSPYALIINGYKTNLLKDIKLLGGDSLLIQVSLKSAESGSNAPLELLDYVDIDQEGLRSTVVLSAWSQDVRVLRDSVLECNTRWSSVKPYRIQGDVLVPEGCVLTIEAGAQLFFDANARLFVGGQLRALGSVENPITFSGVRLEDAYKEISGQWGGIIFGSNSQGSVMKGVILKNAITGILVGVNDADRTPDLVIEDCQIRNMASSGIVAFDTDLVVRNSEFYNCLEHALLGTAGGNYTLIHNTMANFGDFFFEKPAVVLSAAFNDTTKNALRIQLINNVITGASEGKNELLILPDNSLPFEALIRNNYLRTTSTVLDSGQNILNKENNLRLSSIENRILTPDSLSVLIDVAMPLAGFEKDLKGQVRDAKPDIGAYERSKK
ncbi:MAG: right-handed parallel beta-helix repeat-containing protein [Cytophagales bacterium]|nr:MAG: right-handed parallel beta-helix repeat-containing protein [Cytophagales bacterium]TAF62366.1 MAG: right-handed parallel beta-helix repeat-containing protein [Cytophagales bacterium]